MIPYFQWTKFYIGPIPINVWGLMVAIGIVLGLWVAVRVAKQKGLDPQIMLDLGFWSVVAALVGARILYVLSEIQTYRTNPIDVFKVWEGGMSISGGFIGAVIAALVFARIKKMPLLKYVEAALIGLPLGLGCGRIGCFLIHDHPGTPTSSFLGQEYADGIVRFNHGLLLSINGFVMALVFWILWKRNPNRKKGFFTIIFLAWYGVMRFVLDFFRAYDLPNSDARIAGLTWAQYIAVVMVAGAVVLWYGVYRKEPKHLPKKRHAA